MLNGPWKFFSLAWVLWIVPVFALAASGVEPPWYQVTVNQAGVAKGGSAPSTILILTDLNGAFAERWLRADPQIADTALALAVAAVVHDKPARVLLQSAAAGSTVLACYLMDEALPHPPPGSCANNADCSAGEFCAKAVGNCLGTGTCTSRPGMCPLFWFPVCGCDGSTYGNECEAAAAGVNVAYEGMCE